MFLVSSSNVCACLRVRMHICKYWPGMCLYIHMYGSGPIHAVLLVEIRGQPLVAGVLTALNTVGPEKMKVGTESG